MTRNQPFGLSILAAILFAAPAAAQLHGNPADILRDIRRDPAPVPLPDSPRFYRPAPLGGWEFGGSWDGSRVKSMAHEAESAARQARERYRQEKPGNFFKQLSWRAAYESLRSLEEAAEHFHRQVESRWQDPEHTRADYERLAYAYQDALNAVPGAYHFDRIEPDWRRIVGALHGLAQAYQRRGGGRWRWEAVKRTAHEVEEAAEHVHREAERASHHGDYWEQRALADLHELAEAARHFHRQVESYRADPGHSRADFYRLMRAYERAESSFRNAHAYQHVREDFRRVRGLIDELEGAYRDGGDGHGGGHGGGDDDDHGGGHGDGRRWEHR